MGLIDRFTRDERSAAVWWPFALLLIVLCIATFPGANRAANGERSAAQDRSVVALQSVLVGSLGSTDLSAPLRDEPAVTARTALHDVLTDPRVDAVRLWSPEGTLLFSTLNRDGIGSAEALNDAQLGAAAADRGTPVSVISHRTLTGAPARPTFHTYLGLLGTSQPAVGEVEFSESVLLSSVHSAWLGYRIILGIGGLLVLGLAILSMREPAAKIGAGVPFYETSIPHGYSLMALDEQAQLDRSESNAKARLKHVEAKLRESEGARRTAEGQLQRTLSAMATRMNTGGVEPVIPRPASAAPEITPPPAPAPFEPSRRGPRPEPIATPAHEPAARTSKSEPVVVPEAEPVGLPQSEPVAEVAPPPRPRLVAESRPEPVADAKPKPPAAAEPKAKPAGQDKAEPASRGKPKTTPKRLAPQPKPAAEAQPPTPVRAKKVVRLPDVDPGFVLRVPDAKKVHDESEGQDESAVDLLERLVDAKPSHASEVDPGEMRARLARLAASKKPKNREHGEHGEGEHRSD